MLRVPEAWSWESKDPFEKYGAKEVGSRRIEKLATGEAATGQGARVVLTVQEVASVRSHLAKTVQKIVCCAHDHDHTNYSVYRRTGLRQI